MINVGYDAEIAYVRSVHPSSILILIFFLVLIRSAESSQRYSVEALQRRTASMVRRFNPSHQARQDKDKVREEKEIRRNRLAGSLMQVTIRPRPPHRYGKTITR